MEKRKNIHTTERRQLALLPPAETNYETRKDRKTATKTRKRIITYLTIIPAIIIITIATITINSLTPKTAQTPTYTTESIIETREGTIAGVTQTINFGDPTPPGTKIEPQQPIIIQHITENGTTIPIQLTYTKLTPANTQQTYFLKTIIPEEETNNKQFWLATIETTTNIIHSNYNPDITATIIPTSTANNIITEIRLTGWADCEKTTTTATLNNVKTHKETHCMVLITDEEKTINSLQYVGQYTLQENPYSVITGKPIILPTPQ
jgi:hypothetical protein